MLKRLFGTLCLLFVISIAAFAQAGKAEINLIRQVITLDSLVKSNQFKSVHSLLPIQVLLHWLLIRL